MNCTKDKKQLTVIIPFLNEGIEVKSTVQNIKKWVGDRVHIIVINDCSDDGYDYETDMKGLGIEYVINRSRIGAARSKGLGVELSTTPYFLLLDAHMRFYDDKWVDILVDTLEQDDRRILCCQTKYLHKSGNRVYESIDPKELRKRYGAFVNLNKEERILEPQWIFKEKEFGTISEKTPCIYGAGYSASKRYWDRLKGFQGLLGFGLEEAYISIKAYLEGGCCLLMKNVTIGHIYRTKFPYRVNRNEYVYNKLMIAELLLSEDLRIFVWNYYRQIMGKGFDLIIQLFKQQTDSLDRLREYYKILFPISFESVYRMNKTYEDQHRRSEKDLTI